MPYSNEITDLRSPRLRPFAAAAFEEARRLDTDDLLRIVGRQSGYRQGAVAAAAYTFADEAATEAEEAAAEEEQRLDREQTEDARYQAAVAGTNAASRAAEAAVLAAGWTIRYRHGSAGGSLYYWIENPADEYGERHSLRISDHVAPGGSGWNDEKQERHSAPDINIVIRRGADGEYTFDLTPLMETLDR